MNIVAAALGLFLLGIVLLEAFETIVMPRTVTGRFRITRLFYRTLWRGWRWTAGNIKIAGRREYHLSVFGPLSLILLLTLWAALLIVGFALLQWAQGSPVAAPESQPNFATDLYASGVTFFTLGFGDVTPRTGLARFVAVWESAVGFGFLALVISYLPVLYQAFSRREVAIALLDARASSPPTATEILRRVQSSGDSEELPRLLRAWEQWAAEFLESHLSYPVLAFYRSQHDRQSWLSALTAIMDLCALILSGVEAAPVWQARMTFAMCRHALVDLSYVFLTDVDMSRDGRLSPAEVEQMHALLVDAAVPLCDSCAFRDTLAATRRLYEPYVLALSDYFLLPLPAWVPPDETDDNWQASAWERESGSHFYAEAAQNVKAG